jgi:hypothetical protein
MTPDAPLVSEEAFALALFEGSTPHLERIKSRQTSSLGSNHWLFELGIVCEKRVIRVQGASLGIFDPDDVAKQLQAEDEILAKIDPDEVAEHQEKLPPYYSAEQLLSKSLSISTPAELLWTLSFRQYEKQHTKHYQAPLQNRILFTTDSDWETVLLSIARDAEILVNHRLYDPESLDQAFEAVRLCSRMLEHRVGLPLGTADPWGLNAGDCRFYRAEVHLSRLSKVDEHAPDAVRHAAATLLSPDAPNEAQRHEAAAALNDYFLIRLLSVVRQPQTLAEDTADSEELPHLRRQIIEALTAADAFAAASALGPEYSWALGLWRLAPPDQLSQSRIANVVKQTSDVLDSLRRIGNTEIVNL